MLLAATAGAQASCPILPGERNFDYRVTEDRRAVEWRRRGVPGAPSDEPAFCVLQLSCSVKPGPVNMAYTLRPGSMLLGDVSTVVFFFKDGTQQACRVAEARAQ